MTKTLWHDLKCLKLWTLNFTLNSIELITRVLWRSNRLLEIFWKLRNVLVSIPFSQSASTRNNNGRLSQLATPYDAFCCSRFERQFGPFQYRKFKIYCIPFYRSTLCLYLLILLTPLVPEFRYQGFQNLLSDNLASWFRKFVNGFDESWWDHEAG